MTCPCSAVPIQLSGILKNFSQAPDRLGTEGALGSLLAIGRVPRTSFETGGPRRLLAHAGTRGVIQGYRQTPSRSRDTRAGGFGPLSFLERGQRIHVSDAGSGHALPECLHGREICALSGGSVPFFSLRRFSFKIREQAAYNKKIYCVDNALALAMGSRFSEDRGRLYENLVAIELWKRMVNHDCVVYYWKNAEKEEVDFVTQSGTRIQALIQVCQGFEDARTFEREVRALLKAGRELRCDHLLVLSESQEGTEDRKWFGLKGRIHFVPLWMWLSRTGGSLRKLTPRWRVAGPWLRPGVQERNPPAFLFPKKHAEPLYEL